MITYTTRSANLMLRAMGLSMYLACLGLDAGRNFFDICQKWPDGRYIDLVGISNYGNSFMFCGICVLKENQKK